MCSIWFSMSTEQNRMGSRSIHIGLILMFFLKNHFLSDPGVPGVRSMGPVVSHKQTLRACADLTDVTLADEDTTQY